MYVVTFEMFSSGIHGEDVDGHPSVNEFRRVWGWCIWCSDESQFDLYPD